MESESTSTGSPSQTEFVCLVMEPHQRIQHSKSSRAPVITHRGPQSALYSTVYPLVYIFRVFGVAPYDFDNNVLRPSTVNSVYSFVWLCIYMYLFYHIARMYYYINTETEKLSLTITEASKTFFNFAVAFYEIILCFWTREKFLTVWSTIEDYDEEIQRIGCIRSERKTSIFVWSALIISFIVWTAINLSGMYAFSQPWRDNVFYMIVYVGTSVSVVKFSGIVLLLGQRFSHLNSMALDNLSLEPRWIGFIFTVDTYSIERLHESLMSASESLASIYSFSLLCWIASLSLNSTFDVYFIIRRILEKRAEWSLIVIMGSWIVAFLLQLFLIVIACHYAAHEAQAMTYIMMSWKRGLCKRNRSRVVETVMHLKIRKLNFSAAGCFDVNLPLLRTIAATMTTYLVILLQF